MPRQLAAILLLAALGACAGREPWVHPYGLNDPLVGTIRDVATGGTLSQAGLLKRLAEAQFVVIGEAPGNADHVRLSARLVKALGEGKPKLAALALEPLPTDAQPGIVEYLSAHPGDAMGLSQLLGQAAKGALDPLQHEPVLAAALAAGAEIVAPDLPGATIRLVLRQGYKALPPVIVARTGLAQRLPGPLVQDMAAEMAGLACGRVTGRALEPLVRARRARDATMADRLVAVSGRNRGILLAQTAHARTDWGVPWYLQHLQPDALHLSLAFIEVGSPKAEQAAAPPYDFVWYTPSAHPKGNDPCAPFRRSGELFEALAR